MLGTRTPSTHEQVNVREGNVQRVYVHSISENAKGSRDLPELRPKAGSLHALWAMNVKIITRQSTIVRYIGRVSQEDKTYEDMEGKLKQVAKGTQGPSCPQASYSSFYFSSFSSKLKLKPYQGLGSAHH